MGFETRSLRTQPPRKAADHLRNCKRIFLKLVEISRELDIETIEAFRLNREYEDLEMYILHQLIDVEIQP